MYGAFGQFELASDWSAQFGAKGKPIACVGDVSHHGGTIILTNQEDDKLTAMDELVAVETEPEGILQHSCPIPEHGVTPITAVTVKSYHNGKLILTYMAVAGCGARILPRNRRTFVE